jgi:hypothetical protein
VRMTVMKESPPSRSIANKMIETINARLSIGEG